MFREVIANAGDVAFASITPKDIVAGVDKRKHSSESARHFVQTMRGLFVWAMMAGHVTADPTHGVRVKVKKTKGFHTWTEDEIQKYEACYPLGTRQRLALGLYLYTGLRRADMARLGPQHVKNGWIHLETGKPGMAVDLPIMKKLQEILDHSPLGQTTFFASERGRRMADVSLGTWFREVCIAAGVPGRAHGLRKAGAVRLAEAGGTVKELMAVYGWTKAQTAMIYTEMADRKKLSKNAFDKLEDPDFVTPIPAPFFRCGN